MESTVPNSPDSFADKANELVMSFDLTVDEARLASCGLAGDRCPVGSGRRVGERTCGVRTVVFGTGAHTRGSTTTCSPRVSSRAGGAVMMLPIDPDADRSRRAWVGCPACHHGDGCPDCETRRNCSVHWQYLLRNEGPRVIMQCPTCAHLWTTDTSRSVWRSDPSAIAHRKGA